MNKAEKAAKAKLGSKHGIVTHKTGIEAGSIHNDTHEATTLKHGPIARLLGKPARRA